MVNVIQGPNKEVGCLLSTQDLHLPTTENGSFQPPRGRLHQVASECPKSTQTPRPSRREVVDLLVQRYRQLTGTDWGGRGILSRLDIVGIMDDLGFQIGTGKEARTREQDVCSHTVRSFADQYLLCTLFTVQGVDCIRTWAGLARIITAIDLHAKGDLLVAACRELEYKNALSAALFKHYFNFDDGFYLQFLGWLFDPSNFGTAPHGDV